MLRHLFTLILLILVVFLLDSITCPPVSEKPPSTPENEGEKKEDESVEYLSYQKYLREIFSVLMVDQEFAKKLTDAGTSLREKSGEIAKHLDFVGHGIRTQLDEIKRREIDRLRQVLKLRGHLQNGMMKINPNIVLPGVDKDLLMGHLDHGNPNSFEVDDLAKLIKKATADLEEVDKKRRDEFKKYEMEKEYLRKKEMEKLDEQQRAEAEQRHREQEKKHEDHPKLHHPGNEAQLQEVWEDTDGLNKKDFDPRTFFSLHDTNGDGVWDEAEVEALFQNELDKMYDPNAPEDDMMERYEEMNRMREHVMNEVDANHDKLITLDEFVDNTKSKEFKNDEPWDTLENQEVYSDQDFEEFQKAYEEKQRQMREGHIPQEQDHLDPRGHAGQGIQDMHQQQQQQQHHDNQIYEQQQQPVAHQPVVEQPIAHQPVAEQPVAHQPEVQHHEVQQPAVQHHEVQQPVVAQQQEFQQPIVQQQEIQQPAAQQHEVQQPIVQQHEVQQPVAQQHEVQQPVAQQHEVQQPVVQQHEVQQEAVHQ